MITTWLFRTWSSLSWNLKSEDTVLWPFFHFPASGHLWQVRWDCIVFCVWSQIHTSVLQSERAQVNKQCVVVIRGVLSQFLESLFLKYESMRGKIISFSIQNLYCLDVHMQHINDNKVPIPFMVYPLYLHIWLKMTSCPLSDLLPSLVLLVLIFQYNFVYQVYRRTKRKKL